MKNIIEKIKSNNVVKYCLIAGILVIAIVIICLMPKNDKKDDSKELLEKFELAGLDFYENFYFPQIGSNSEEVQKFLSKYSSTGIKVSLDNLIKINYKSEEYGEVLNKLAEKCDKSNTKVVVYPESPYEQKAYRNEIVTECNFEQ